MARTVGLPWGAHAVYEGDRLSEDSQSGYWNGHIRASEQAFPRFAEVAELDGRMVFGESAHPN